VLRRWREEAGEKVTTLKPAGAEAEDEAHSALLAPMLPIESTVEKIEQVVPALWLVLAEFGLCDELDSSEYRRCRDMVVDFVESIADECNEDEPA
jgi:hypothetical protein